MERRRSDTPAVLGAIAALAITGGIIYAAVDAAMLSTAVDSNSSNATTQGPPTSFDTP
jgi:hypothetical protein